MTSQQIAEIVARWQASTPGEWITCAGSDDHRQPYANEVIAVRDNDPETSGLDHVLTVPELDDRPADLIFAAHAHQDIPALVEEIGRLNLKITELTADLRRSQERADHLSDLAAGMSDLKFGNE